MVYNLSIFDLTEQQRLNWYSPDDDVKMCVVKGRDEVIIYLFIDPLRINLITDNHLYCVLLFCIVVLLVC